MFDETDNSGVDNDQKIKESDTLQLLVTAGYFRARIKGLSSFDKVIGGMTWCIQGCSMNIDIDLLFQENWNIGKKIALTEKIVKVLRKMKCPHRIEPHQIQGSDFIHIYPVVQWLVKEALGRQDERMAEMRILASQFFDTHTGFKEDLKECQTQVAGSANATTYIGGGCADVVDFINKAYWPQRRYRKPDTMKNSSEDTSVISTLLEYGRREIIGSIGKMEQKDGSNRNSVIAQSDRGTETDVQDIQKQMSSQVKDSTKMASKIVSKLFKMKVDDIHEAAEQYENKMNVLLQASQKSAAARAESLKTAIGDIKSEISTIKENTEETLQQISELNVKLEETEKEISTKRAKLKSVTDKIEEAVKHFPANIDIDEVQDMVNRLEQLKKEEQQLKSTYKKEDEELTEKYHRIVDFDEPIDEEVKEMEIEEMLNHEKKRLHNGRLRLAKRTCELKHLELFLDNIPSKREIQQYHKRFVELNDQINYAYSENKQLYDMYNILDSVKDCLQREVNLLNSIYENFKETLQNQSNKDQMVKQLEQVANTIRDLKRNGESQKEKTKADRDQRKEEFNSLVEKSRQYAKLTKQIQELLPHYEKLLQKCQELGISDV